LPAYQVANRIYLIGGPSITDKRDCCVYLLDGGGELALVDAGLGASGPAIVANMQSLGYDPSMLKYVVATHGHIDHTGGLYYFRSRGAKIVCHAKELEAVSGGRPELTAAGYYGVKYRPVKVDVVLKEDEETIRLGNVALCCLLTPGHTPGSISPYVDIGDTRILFGQDIHGPFNPAWGSNMEAWFSSMQKLLELKADILCEGHFGVYSPESEVTRYINYYINLYQRHNQV